METYLKSLELVDDGDKSSNINIGDSMPAPWCASEYLATGQDMYIFNPRAKENRWVEEALKQLAKIKERALGRFCGGK